MENLGYSIGYLLSLSIYLVKSIIQFIFKLFGVKAFKEEITKPENPVIFKDNKDSYTKGEEFENYVRSHIFTKDKFKVIERTHSYKINKHDFVESTLKPDFKFRDYRTGREFYVEAKFRSNLNKDFLEFSYPNQFERYKGYAKELKFYIVLGLEGTSDSPKHLFIIDVSDLKSYKLHETELSKIKYRKGMYLELS